MYRRFQFSQMQTFNRRDWCETIALHSQRLKFHLEDSQPCGKGGFSATVWLRAEFHPLGELPNFSMQPSRSDGAEYTCLIVPYDCAAMQAKVLFIHTIRAKLTYRQSSQPIDVQKLALIVGKSSGV